LETLSEVKSVLIFHFLNAFDIRGLALTLFGQANPASRFIQPFACFILPIFCQLVVGNTGQNCQTLRLHVRGGGGGEWDWGHSFARVPLADGVADEI
jgi:hypothetical protein